MKLSKNAFEGLYTGLSIGIGIAGFVLVSLLMYYIMPVFSSLGDFMSFLWVCGWTAIWVIYGTLYTFGAYIAWFPIKKAILKES